MLDNMRANVDWKRHSKINFIQWIRCGERKGEPGRTGGNGVRLGGNGVGLGGTKLDWRGNGVGLEGERGWTGKGNMIELGGTRLDWGERGRTGGNGVGLGGNGVELGGTGSDQRGNGVGLGENGIRLEGKWGRTRKENEVELRGERDQTGGLDWRGRTGWD